jgi:hypothetical protein
MEQIKNIVIIVLSVILLKCCIKSNDRIIETEVEYLPGKSDTVYITHTVVKKDILPSSVTVIRDTIHDTLVYEFNRFTTDYNDSLLSLQIVQDIDGVLLKSDIQYTFKQPSVTRVDTLKITERIDKNGLYIGTQFGYRNITPYASYLHKSYKFDLGFNFFNRTPMVGIGVKL